MKNITRVFNPVLSDAPLIDPGDDGVSVFLTPLGQKLERRLPLINAVAAAVLLFVAFVGRIMGVIEPLVDLFTFLTFLLAGTPALASVWKSLRAARIDIDALMLLGAGLAAWIGSPMEGALLLVLFALSGAFESFSVGRARSAIAALRELTPERTMVQDESGLRVVRLKEVKTGQRVLVGPGERIPLDGIILEGISAVDESAITGESVPRDVAAGHTVFAGTLNAQGQLSIQVTKTAGNTTLARVVDLVEEAREKKASVQTLIDRIGPPYSMGVMGFALAVAVLPPLFTEVAWHASIYRGISLLIVGSPCALIIATPVAYLSAIAGAAKRGVLVKGGAYLEALAGAKAMVFDKTGTLTTGQIRVVDVVTTNGHDPNVALRTAGALEASSSHPLGQAVMAALRERNLPPLPSTGVTSIPGQTLVGTVEDRQVAIGKPEALLENLGNAEGQFWADRVRQVRERGQTASLMLVDSTASVLVFEDVVRKGAAECMNALRRQGISHLEMLTGDHELVARSIARQLDLTQFSAGMLPQEKLERVRLLHGQLGGLVMVGDGVNDAPSLAGADVGIAIGSRGADAALDAADMVLLGEGIERLAWIHLHAKRTAAIVRQNLAIAIGVIASLSILALFTTLPLPIAVVGHEGSTLLVALNALRLLKQ